MGILALSADERVRDVRVSEDTLTVDLMDGRSISVPLVWYPRLLSGTAKQRSKLEGVCCWLWYSLARSRRGFKYRRLTAWSARTGTGSEAPN